MIGSGNEPAAAGLLSRLHPAIIYGVAVIFLIYHWAYLLNGQILYGGMISWQFMPATIAYYDALHAGHYPFFFWNLGSRVRFAGGFATAAVASRKTIAGVAVAHAHHRIDTWLVVLHIALLLYATIRASLYFWMNLFLRTAGICWPPFRVTIAAVGGGCIGLYAHLCLPSMALFCFCPFS